MVSGKSDGNFGADCLGRILRGGAGDFGSAVFSFCAGREEPSRHMQDFKEDVKGT